ncbi:t-SNARE [Kockiozyma suomiensis]|uniref:t-SNARE n=1 Tax=Kockiozyma suomiensis TaxID=1337062 RepID=UPI003343F640
MADEAYENLVRHAPPPPAYRGYDNYSSRRDPYDDQAGYEMDDVSGAVSQAELDLNRFFADIDELKQSIVVFEAQTAKVEGMQRQMFEISGNISEAIEMQREIDALTARSASMARQLKDSIRSLESRSMRDSTKALQVAAIKKMFLDSLQNYHMTESTFQQRIRVNVERQYRIVQPDATDEQIREAVDNNGQGQVFTQALLSSDRTGRARTVLEEVRQRQQEIFRIEQTMKEVAILMEQLMEQVEIQGDDLEEVEDKQFAAQEEVEVGKSHVIRARNSARSARKKKFICLAIVLIIIVIIAVVLGVHFSHNGKSDDN